MAAAAEEASTSTPLRVGVLAVQGSYREHCALLRRCGISEAVEVRKPEQLAGLGGLIIPGGESTTMAKVAEKYGLIPAMQEFAAEGKPIWGTCAGLIFLADRALGQKKGGQALLGGLDCTVHRNFFGSQLASFETELPVPAAFKQAEGSSEDQNFRAVFIRAPAIMEVGPGVETLAEYPLGETKRVQYKDGESDQEVSVDKIAVAVRQGSLLATAFHPELTSDPRWHAFFLEMVKENQGKVRMEENGVVDRAHQEEGLLRPVTRPADLPVFREQETLSFEL